MISLINIKENPQQMPNTFAFSKYIFGEKIQFRCRGYHVHLVSPQITIQGSITSMFYCKIQKHSHNSVKHLR